MNRPTPKNISRRTKEGDRVFSGIAVFTVVHKIGAALVLKPEIASDFHFYVHSLEGGSKRFNDYQSALNYAALPVVAAQIETARASYA